MVIAGIPVVLYSLPTRRGMTAVKTKDRQESRIVTKRLDEPKKEETHKINSVILVENRQTFKSYSTWKTTDLQKIVPTNFI